MKNYIKHIWFDMDGTLTVHTDQFNKAHDELRYKVCSEVVGRPVDENLIHEYENLYQKAGSNSAVFTSLGKESDFWMGYFGTIDQISFHKPIPDVYKTLEKLKAIVPISLFTNNSLINIQKTFGVINIDQSWFTHIISGNDIKNRKPHLEGFKLMIDKSNLPPENILFVGDRIKVEIVPANEVGIQSGLIYGKSELADYNFENFSDILSII